MMFAMLDNQQSASQRMLGTTVAMNLNKPDDEIVHALVKRMNDDPNTNVRLAALDALIQFHEDPAVRHQLIESLSTQKDPAVQISLIQFLVRLKEKEVVNQLQHIVDDNRTIKAVKDEALSGILKLS
jgi:HEAT repeat protein